MSPSSSKWRLQTEAKQDADETIPDSRPMAVEPRRPDHEPIPPTLRSG